MKKRVKSILAVALAAAMLLGGCQNGEKSMPKLDPKNPTAIEIWHYYNGPQKAAFDEMVKEFNETTGLEKGIIVEAFSQGNVNDLAGKVMDAANKKVGASEVPDIFAAYADTAYAIDQLGLVANLDPYLTEEEIKEYVAGYLEEGRFDEAGNLKIFPVAKSTEIFMLNKTDWNKFAQATGASLDSLNTMEGVVDTAKRYYEWTDSLTPAPNDGKAFFGRDAMANYFIIGCKQLGVEIFSVSQGKVKLNLDKEVIKKLWNHYYVPYINGYFAAYGKFRSDDAKTGDLIALVGSTSGATYFPDQVTVNDTDSYPIEALVLPAPIFEDGEHYAVQQGAGMVVTKSDEASEYASVEFLKWFTDAQRNSAFSVQSGYLPVKVSANDADSLLKAGGEGISANMKLTLPVAVQMVKENTLYTSKAFENGNSARNVLETCMQNQADEDYQKVKEQIKQGADREKALAPYLTEEYFDQWYAGFEQQLKEAAKIS